MATNTKEQRTRQAILLLALKNAGADSFLVNVIALHHKNPTRKLRGLLELVKNGHEIKVAAFDIDVLMIDGERCDWASLEAAARRATAEPIPERNAAVAEPFRGILNTFSRGIQR